MMHLSKSPDLPATTTGYDFLPALKKLKAAGYNKNQSQQELNQSANITVF